MLVNIVDDFLSQHCANGDKLLLGLSGGSDSLALLYLLLELKSRHKFDLHVAYLDHGWRDSSAKEAKKLSELAKSLNIPFHLKKLNPQIMTGNLEDACRVSRFKYFAELCQKYNLKAVLLGHHGDDRAETVLKRLFEGASLTNLSGFWEEAIIYGVTVWRPLINASKADILSWLKEKNLSFFDDETNRDNKFLRARMRNEIIPFLAQKFGKEIKNSLCQIGDDAQKLKEYLERRVDGYSIIYGPFGQLLDLSEKRPREDVELQFLLKKFCADAGITISRPILNTLQKLLTKVKRVEIEGKKIIIDRNRLFILQSEIKNYVDWKIIFDNSKKTSWRDIWKGEIFINMKNCQIGPPDLRARYHGTELGKWYTNNKVPSFMRATVPVLWSNGEIAQEFLTGR